MTKVKDHFAMRVEGIVKLLCGVTVTLVLLHLLANIFFFNVTLDHFWFEFLLRFSMDEEISIPTWYNQILFLLLAAGLAFIAVRALQNKEKYRYHWVALSLLSVYLSVDEGAGLHEILGLLDIPQKLGISSSFFGFGWVFLGGILVAVVAGVFLRFWLQLPRRTRLLFALSVAVFVAGSIGVEMMSSYYIIEIADRDFIYNGPLVALEEGLEQIGIIIALYAALDYARQRKLTATILLQ